MQENAVLLLFLGLPPMLLLAAWKYIRKVKNQHTKTGWRSLVIGNALVLAFLLSVLVLSGEMYFRFVYDTTDSFSVCKTTKRWFERYYQRNLTGFRDTINYLPTIAPGQRRVSFVGDSFTAGHGIKKARDRFANRLRALRPDCEVHVLAENGLDTGKELELLKFLPQSGYQTDVVVLVYCLNDISDIVPEFQAVLTRIYEAPDPGFFVNHSYLFNTLHARLRILREQDLSDYYGFTRKAYEGPIWAEQQHRLKKCRDAVSATGGHLVVVTFPFLHALGKQYPYRSIHRQLGDFWKEQGVPHLDLLEIYEHESPDELVVNPRDAHPNEKAHAMAAEAIAAFLDPLLETLPPPLSRPVGPAVPSGLQP